MTLCLKPVAVGCPVVEEDEVVEVVEVVDVVLALALISAGVWMFNEGTSPTAPGWWLSVAESRWELVVGSILVVVLTLLLYSK